MGLIRIGDGYVNTEQISYISLKGTQSSIRVKMVDGEYLDFPYKTRTEFEKIQDTLTCSGLYNIMACAKKIRDCCQFYRYNPETNYCEGCPFYQKDSYFTGCILQDGRRNEVDNPGDWCLD